MNARNRLINLLVIISFHTGYRVSLSFQPVPVSPVYLKMRIEGFFSIPAWHTKWLHTNQTSSLIRDSPTLPSSTINVSPTLPNYSYLRWRNWWEVASMGFRSEFGWIFWYLNFQFQLLTITLLVCTFSCGSSVALSPSSTTPSEKYPFFPHSAIEEKRIRKMVDDINAAGLPWKVLHFTLHFLKTAH